MFSVLALAEDMIKYIIMVVPSVKTYTVITWADHFFFAEILIVLPLLLELVTTKAKHPREANLFHFSASAPHISTNENAHI